MPEAFVHNIEQLVAGDGVDLITFEKGQRKDDVTQRYAEIQEERGRAVCRQGAGKGPHHADRVSSLSWSSI
jgi:hypothetical protein